MLTYPGRRLVPGSTLGVNVRLVSAQLTLLVDNYTIWGQRASFSTAGHEVSMHSYERHPRFQNYQPVFHSWFTKTHPCFRFSNIKIYIYSQDRHIFRVSGFSLFPWAQESRSAELLLPHSCFSRVEGKPLERWQWLFLQLFLDIWLPKTECAWRSGC